MSTTALGASHDLISVTRSGANTFATEVFVYHRNEAFNATNFFNKAAGAGEGARAVSTSSASTWAGPS